MAPAVEAPFQRIYRGLRAELARAAHRPGIQLRVDEQARRFGLSPTPMREALWRLAGERLVAESRRRGFFVPLLTADDIHQLYSGLEFHLLATIRAPAATGCGGAPGDFYPLLAGILLRSSQRVLVDAGLLWIERLATARLVEPGLFDTGADHDMLAVALDEGDPDALARAIRRYCRRRAARSADLARAIAALADRADEYIPDML